MIITRHKRIAAGGTIAITDKSIALRQLVIVVSNAGTNWNIQIEDNDSTPAIVVPPVEVGAPSLAAWINQKFEHPVPVTDGLDFKTNSGTPGVLDLWYSFDKPSS